MKAIKIFSLSAVLASSLFASVTLSDNELIAEVKKAKKYQLATLQMATNYEKLQNEQLILAQRLHDIEEALGKLEGCKCGISAQLNIDSKNKAKSNKGANSAKSSQVEQNETFNSELKAQEELLLKALNDPLIPKEQREALLNAHLQKNYELISKQANANQIDSRSVKAAKTTAATKSADKKKSKSTRKLANKQITAQDLWMMLDKSNIEQKVIVQSERLNVRELPSMAAKIVKHLNKGDEIQFNGVARSLSTNGALWLKIDTGYIYAGLTNFNELVKRNTKALKEQK